MHPTRKLNRTRGTRLVRDPIAFGAINLAENPNAGLRRASPLNWSQRNHTPINEILRRIGR